MSSQTATLAHTQNTQNTQRRSFVMNKPLASTSQHLQTSNVSPAPATSSNTMSSESDDGQGELDEGENDKHVLEDRPHKISASGWADLDISIVIALVSPLGHWLTGGDHIKNLFLIIFMVLYLHQLIQVPWELYKSSLPRRPPLSLSRKSNSTSSSPTISAPAIDLAHSELQAQQLYYLFLTVISPFLGATFLSYVLSQMGGTEISWFSITLFVLATGLRPWGHLINRLRRRTHDLHDVVHYPHPESEYSSAQQMIIALQSRVIKLESTIHQLKVTDKKQVDIEGMYEDLSGGLDDIETMLRRVQRKGEVARVNQEAKIAAMERCLKVLMEERRNGHNGSRMLPSSKNVRSWVDMIWSIARPYRSDRGTQPYLVNGSGKAGGKRAHSLPSLETIAEVDDLEIDGGGNLSPPSPMISPPLSPTSAKRHRFIPTRSANGIDQKGRDSVSPSKRQYTLVDLTVHAVTLPVTLLLWTMLVPRRIWIYLVLRGRHR